nr:U5-200K [Euglena gracilis]
MSSYRPAANLVIAQKDVERRSGHEPTGEPESLASRISTMKMGDRYQRTKPDIKKRRLESDFESATKRLKKGSAKLPEFQNQAGYIPKTKETREAYSQLLKFLGELLGVADYHTVKDAAEDVLDILKDGKLKDNAKVGPLQELLGHTLSQEQFRTLLTLAGAITDYAVDLLDASKMQQDTLDSTIGVSVVFEDDDESEAGNDLHTRVLKNDKDEAADEEDEDEGQDTAVKGQLATMEDDDDDGEDETLLDAHVIDAYWIQREMGPLNENEEAEEGQKNAERVLALLADEAMDDQSVEKQLVLLFQYRNFEFIKRVCRNRWKVVYCTRLARAEDDRQRGDIEAEMGRKGQAAILEELQSTKAREGKQGAEAREFKKTQRSQGAVAAPRAALEEDMKTRTLLDLETLSFEQGGHFMSNKKCELPQGSFRQSRKGYEEVHVPAVKPKDVGEVELIKIGKLPKWAQPAFEGYETLNPVQSKMFKAAFSSQENLLLCAPTGAGKTNVAMLAILAELGKHLTEDGKFELDAFKVVYVAPMKALVQEVAATFQTRLKAFGINVRELTGDRQMTKAQIEETQVIVTTPEKWDIVTRKSGDRTYTQLVRLLIVDEVHLLHDHRGPVLEAIIARTIRQIEATQEMIRIVGLSATLPNYRDVAHFLRVSRDHGLFHFDNSWRPVPLQQQYIGITEKKPLKRFQLMNEICYEKVMEQAGKNQVLVFVHSRKDTAKTAKALCDMALQHETLEKFLKEGSASAEILRESKDQVSHAELRDLLPYGFAIHHAGMMSRDRKMVEDLFREGHIHVLVSTATLAWGVNLPAHTVIIKGTQIYDPEQGKWTELSALDVMQMMGRAGRPQYDTRGEGIIITSHAELQYYLSLMNQQLPIESQLVAQLPDLLNAEIVLGTVQNTKEAITWLGYTYLYVRMLRAPGLYSVTKAAMQEDPLLEQHRADLVHTAATVLDRNNLIRYDRKTGVFQVTDLGRVASHYYIHHTSIQAYNEHLKPNMMDLEVFRVFALSHEFKNLTVREEERQELAKLLEQVPIPVKETVDEPAAKINVLLQAYIANVRLEGFALMADMVYVTQSAARIFRALHEIVLRRGWAQLTDKVLKIAIMVERRMWLSHSPLRQFKGVPMDVIRKLERKDISWDRFYDLEPTDVGDLVRNQKHGKNLYKLIHQLPRLDLSAHVQPITRSLLRVELTITPDFQYDPKIHGASEAFWILVEDVDGEVILHYEQFLLKAKFAKEEHYVYFTVPIQEPLPPQYFVRVVSERWLWVEATLPISFRHLLLPEKYPPHTELLDLQPLPVSALRNPQFEALYTQFSKFNPIQTQVFHTLYQTDDNILVGAPTGSGKTICIEFAILRMFNSFKPQEKARAVYVAPHEDVCQQRYQEWKLKFDDRLGRTVVQLTGETSADLKLLEKGEIIVSTPEHWDVISRRWKQRKNVTNVKLFIVDDLHLISGPRGPCTEVIVSRMRYISSQMVERYGTKIRIVAAASSLANARDLGEWIGATHTSIFNFHPSVRPVPLEIHIQGFDNSGFQSRMFAMYKPTFLALRTHSPDKPVIIFVPEKKYTYDVAVELIGHLTAEDDPEMFLKVPLAEIRTHLSYIKDEALRKALEHGIGFYHEGLTDRDKTIASKLFESGAIQVFLTSYRHCWGIEPTAHCVIIMGTQFYDGREHRHADYPITDVLQMMGRACRPLVDECGKCVIFCHAPKKEYYKKFLYDPLPVESHLHHFLADHLNAQIVTKEIAVKQDAVDYLTWTFLYRRLKQNPNYYNLQGVTHNHLSDYLSELVEVTINALEASKCITVEEDGMTPLNLGMIASYYYTQYTTLELFAQALAPRIKLKGLIEILASASEYDTLPVRYHEDDALAKLGAHCPHKLPDPKWTDPHTKANVLLQCHFSRRRLPADMEDDRKVVLEKAIPLVQAMVDVIASNRWLTPALAAMELSQMLTQGLWDKDPILLQLPHFTPALAKKCSAKGVESVFDLLELEDETRWELLGLSDAKLHDLAVVCNQYPNVNVDFSVLEPTDLHAGQPVTVSVSLERELDEAEPVPKVSAPLFPKEKDEGWWLVLGDAKRNQLFAIKRLTLQRKARVNLEFMGPKPGQHRLTLYLMSDCYLGCDQEYEVQFETREGEDDDEEMED